MLVLVKKIFFVTLVSLALAKNYEVPTNEEYVWIYYSDSITTVSLKAGGDYTKLEKLYIVNQLLDMKAAYSLIEELKNVPSLTEFSVSSNRIAGSFDIGKIQPLKGLENIWINNNSVTDIVNSATENMPSITLINLNQNNLMYLNLKIFEKFINLEYLFLYKNQLILIDGYEKAKTILPKIKFITIKVNNFVCSDLEKMVSPFQQDFWKNDFNLKLRSEPPCTGLKKERFDDITCCYPNAEDQMNDAPTINAKQLKTELKVSKLESDKTLIQQELADQKKTNQQLKEKIDNVTEANKLLLEEVDNLKNEKNSILADLKEFKNFNQKQEENISNDLKLLREEINRVTSSLKASISQLETDKDSILADLAEQKKINQQILEKSSNDMKKFRDEVDIKINGLSTTISNLEAEKTSILSDLTEQKKTNKQLLENISQFSSSISRLEAEKASDLNQNKNFPQFQTDETIIDKKITNITDAIEEIDRQQTVVFENIIKDIQDLNTKIRNNSESIQSLQENINKVRDIIVPTETLDDAKKSFSAEDAEDTYG